MFEPETPSVQQTAALPAATPSVEYPFRLLQDEMVLGTFPIAQSRRPLGKIASFLFVTDSRVIYSAEAKTITSSSTHSREFLVGEIKGLEVGRHTGLDALGLTALLGLALNFVTLLIISASIGTFYNSFVPPETLAVLFTLLAVSSLIIAVVVFFVLRRSNARLAVVGPPLPQFLSNQADTPKLLITILMFFIFGLLAGFVFVVWYFLRELGMFKADDAELFADPNNIDRIARDAGALIIDVQSRGKLAAKV